MLRVELTVAYQGVQVVAGLKFVPKPPVSLCTLRKFKKGKKKALILQKY